MAKYLENGYRYDLGPVDDQYEMTYWDSNGHMTDDVNMLRAQYLGNGWR